MLLRNSRDGNLVSHNMPSIVFDALSTLLCWREPAEMLDAMFAVHVSLFPLVFGCILRDYMCYTLANDFKSFSSVLFASLQRSLEAAGIDTTGRDADVDLVVQRFADGLKLDPIVNSVFRLFQDGGWNVYILTQVDRESLHNSLRNAEIDFDFDNIVTCDEIGRCTPHSKVYEYMREKMTASATEPAWYVSAHASDLMGAKKAGFDTCWLTCLEKKWMYDVTLPDQRADRLWDIVEQLLEDW